MFQENLKSKGSVNVRLLDRVGRVKQNIQKDNLVVNTGKAWLAARALTAVEDAMTHMAVGTGTTAPAVTQTTLVTESARVAFDGATQVTKNVLNDSMQYVATFNPGVATAALTEAGLLNADVAGTLLSRITFPVVNKGAEDTLVITWVITMV